MQINIYALAVHEILGVTPKSGIIYFLKNNFESVESITATSIKEFESRLRNTQESIIKFSKESARYK